MKIKMYVMAAAILGSMQLEAQSLTEAIKLTESERYEAASEKFRSLITSDASGDAYFYYGDNFLKWEETDSAKFVFNKGLQAHPQNPFVHVGLGKVAWIEGNTAAATASFTKARELAKSNASYTKEKNAKLLMEIAEAYISGSSKKPDEAIALLTEAEKLNNKDPELYIVLGDALMEKNVVDASMSIKNYEKAYELDKTSLMSYLRQGQLYTRVRNFEEAMKYYNQALQIDPNFAPVYRERAELNYKWGKVSQGIEDYRKYLELNDSPSARSRYAVFLYVAKDYKAAIDEANAALSSGNTNPVLYRILGYSNYETKNYTLGLEQLERFLETAQKQGKPKIIMQDYSYHGKLLAATGKDSLGILEIHRALELDPNWTEGYADLATIYYRMKNYPQSIQYYRLKIGKVDRPDYNDYNYLGRALFSNKEYASADSAFAKVAELLPNHVIGYLWRAKSNSKLDDQEMPKGLAKPYYEKVIELASADPEKNRKDLIEAYSYLGFYYVVNKDFACAKAAWSKVKELDAANTAAEAALSDKAVSGAGNCELPQKQEP